MKGPCLEPLDHIHYAPRLKPWPCHFKHVPVIHLFDILIDIKVQITRQNGHRFMEEMSAVTQGERNTQ